MILIASTWFILTLTSIYILKSSVSAQDISKVSSDDTKVIEDNILQNDKYIQDVLKSINENPTMCLIISSCLCSLIIYLLIKCITSKPGLDSLEVAMAKKQSEISKLESETKSIEKEINVLEKKIEEKKKEEEQFALEENKLKIKIEEKVKDELKTKELDMGLLKHFNRLNELKEKRNSIGGMNGSIRDELAHLKDDQKSLENDIIKKEAEVASSREVVLKERLREVTESHSKLLHCKEKASERLQQLVDSIEKLMMEKEQHEISERKNMLWINHYSTENNILEPSLEKLKSFEEKLNRNDDDDDDDDDDDEVLDQLKKYTDKLLVEDDVKSGVDELELMRQALANDHNDNKHLEDDVCKVKSDLSLLIESCKIVEKDAKTASIKLDIVEDKERNLMLRLDKLEEKDYLDDCQVNEDKINQLMLLAQQYKTEAEVLRREIEIDEKKFREKVALLEREANMKFVTCRKTEQDSVGLQRDIDSLNTQVSELKEEADKAEAKYQSLMATMIPRPAAIRPFIGYSPSFPPFPPPPPNFHTFRPLLHRESNSMRSTPYNQLERPFGPSPVNRSFRDNHDSSTSGGPRRQGQPPPPRMDP